MISLTAYEYVRDKTNGSFAKWEPKTPGNPKNASGVGILMPYGKVASQLKPHIIFVGMNLAAKVGPFENFHSPKHNDYRLRDLITGTPFEGAYMTDLFKKVGSNATEVERYYKSNPEALKSDIDAFVEECKTVCPERKILICIGTGYHYETICKSLRSNQDFVIEFMNPAESAKPCYYIPHYSSAAGLTDSQYATKAKKALDEIRYDLSSRGIII